jgi:Conserved TM helix
MVYAESISDQLTTLLGSVVAVAVKVVIFLVIMALGWIVGNWIYKWLGKLLRRVGFDRAVERGGLHRVLGNTKASDLTGRLVELAFLLFVLQLAFGIFGPNPVSDLIRNVVAWLPKLLVAVVIVVVTAAVAGWVKELIRNGLAGLSYGAVIGTAAQVLILALGLIAALNQVGVATSVTLPVLIAALATFSGIAIVGVGGGLVKPMQHRWERMLNRAETETALAAQQVRAHRAEAARVRNVNEPGGFGQPAYPGGAPSDAKKPTVEEQAQEQQAQEQGQQQRRE